MKNLRLLQNVLLFIAISVCSNSNSVMANTINEKNTIFYEGFNEIWPPFGWEITQNGTGTTTWDQQFVNDQLLFSAFHSYTETDENPDSWLISPPISLEENNNYILTFSQKNQYVPSSYDFNGVMISTGSAQAGSEDFQLLHETNYTINEFTETQINLNNFAGNTIYIAFVYKGSYSNDWWIDDIEISVTDLDFYDFTMLDPVGNGSVTPTPGTTQEIEQTQIHVSALPDVGNEFVEWNLGDVDDPNSHRTFTTITDDQTVQATFQEYDLDLLYIQGEIGGQSFVNSALSTEENTNLEAADNFSNSTIDQIHKLVVYGVARYYDTTFFEWEPEPTEPFIIRFYDEGPDVVPHVWSDPVSEQFIEAKAFLMGFNETANYSIIKMEMDLNTPVSLKSGWVSFQINMDEGAQGWFGISKSNDENGNNKCWRINNNTNNHLVFDYDMMIEIWGTETEPNVPLCANYIYPEIDQQDTGFPVADNPHVELKWQEVSNATGYQLFWGETLPETGIDLGNQTSFLLEDLEYNTEYEWKIIPYNENGLAQNCSSRSFSTMDDPTLFPPFFVDFPDNQLTPPLHWDDQHHGKLEDDINFETSELNQWLYMPFAGISTNERSASLNLYINPVFNNQIYRWFMSPPIFIGDNTENNLLVFDMAIPENEGQLGANDKIHVIVSDDGGKTWSPDDVIFSLTGENQDVVDPQGKTFSLGLNGYSDFIKVAFYVERESGELPNIQVYIGNIRMVTGVELSLEANPQESGTLSGAGMYIPGMDVTIEAIPEPGYNFANWSDDQQNVLSENTSYTFTMPAQSTTLTANFNSSFLLSLESLPENGGNLYTEGYYEQGEQIEITADPNNNFSFLNWTDEQENIISEQETFLFTMPDQDITLFANFRQGYNLTLLSNPENAGTLYGEGVYFAGASVDINAIANENYIFQNWTDEQQNVIDDQSITSILMPEENLILTANFEHITAVQNWHGSENIVFPNPSTDGFKIKTEYNIANFSMSDISGKIILRMESVNRNELQITNRLDPGTYIITLETEKKTIKRKIIVY